MLSKTIHNETNLRNNNQIENNICQAEVIDNKVIDLNVFSNISDPKKESFKLLRPSLEHQIENLDWWHDLKSNIKMDDFNKAILNLQPEFKRTFTETFLISLDTNMEKKIFFLLNISCKRLSFTYI